MTEKSFERNENATMIEVDNESVEVVPVDQ